MTNFINDVILQTDKGKEIKDQRDNFLMSAYDVMFDALEYKVKGFEFDERDYAEFLMLYSRYLYRVNQNEKAAIRKKSHYALLRI